jgi:hypothetical protein
MKNVWFSILLFTAMSCQGQQDSSWKLSPDAFEKGIGKADIQVLDVRTSGEYRAAILKMRCWPIGMTKISSMKE